MPHQVGERIDQYKILELLGEGGFASAYLVQDQRDDRLAVLKWPDESLLGDPTVFEHFRREMAITRRLHHSNIQCAIDGEVSRSAPYLVLEYTAGVPLHRYLRERGRLPVEESVLIARQIAAGLQYMHEHHVYHRDLKPENVIIAPDGTVKIIDFGIALMEGSRRMTWRWLTNATGTPAYMAPEQIQGKRGDARTDVYAMGVMLYEMLAGRVPWEGDNPLAVMSQHLNAPFPPIHELVPDVPAPVEGIVRKCLRKDPENRYQDAAALLSDLEGWHDLDLGSFVFADEAPVKAETQRGLWLLVAGISIGFVVACTLLVVLYYVLVHWAK